jgi:hypothetical protein
MLSQDILNKIIEMKPFYKERVFKNLYSWKELESLLNNRPFVSSNRLTIINSKLKDGYVWPAGGWLTDLNTFPPSLINSELKKYVCYLKDCSRVKFELNEICKQLEETIKNPTDVHIFFSLKEPETDLKGFSIHKDTQHNIITLVDGLVQCKVWLDKDKEPIIDREMQEGDIVFIPAGVYHQIIPKTKRLSISFPMAPRQTFFQERDWVKL